MPETVLITGCSSGIGRAAAESFLADGWTVYATARTPTDIADLGERGCETAELDVTDQADVERVVARVVDEQGSIDCLVNNAGIAQAGALEQVPVERLERQFDVNVFGIHRMTRAVLPHMREQGDGTIVNVSSVAGRVSFPGMGSYAGTKYAMEGLSDALRVEVGEFGVDVVLVEPGWARTRFGEKGERLAREIEDPDNPYQRLHDNAVLVKDLLLSDPIAGRVEAVAEAILAAANDDDPDPRQVVLANGKVLVLGEHVPDRLRDRLLALTFWSPLGPLRERLRDLLPSRGG